MLSLIPNKYVDSDNEAQVTVETVPTDFDDADLEEQHVKNFFTIANNDQVFGDDFFANTAPTIKCPATPSTSTQLDQTQQQLHTPTVSSQDAPIQSQTTPRKRKRRNIVATQALATKKPRKQPKPMSFRYVLYWYTLSVLIG